MAGIFVFRLALVMPVLFTGKNFISNFAALR